MKQQLYHYIIRVYTTYDPEDGFNVWTDAPNDEQALNHIRGEYHSITDLLIISKTKI